MNDSTIVLSSTLANDCEVDTEKVTTTKKINDPPQRNTVLTIVQAFVFAVFGLLVPLVLVYQTVTFMGGMSPSFKLETPHDVSSNFLAVRDKLRDVNDYMLLSYLQSERANYSTMMNKQAMKVAVMNIGFAVASIGILFIVLGFKGEGGVVAKGEGSLIKFDLATGSAGLAIFILGATMSGIGGILPNEYTTVGIPGYFYIGPSSTAVVGSIGAQTAATELTSREKEAVAEFLTCTKENEKDGSELARCFVNRFFQTYKQELRK